MARVLFLSVLVCMVGSMNWKHKSTLNLSILTFIRRKLVLLAETRQQQLPKQILLKSVNNEHRAHANAPWSKWITAFQLDLLSTLMRIEKLRQALQFGNFRHSISMWTARISVKMQQSANRSPRTARRPPAFPPIVCPTNFNLAACFILF